MSPRSFVAYLRVSTQRQGRSGLGMEAQEAAITAYLATTGGRLVDRFVEIESGAKIDRPALAEAMATCRLKGATLVIAKLDRLSRDAAFLLGLARAGVDFIAADLPGANRMTVGIMAVVAEEERRMISDRTRAALTAAKARGVVLGGWRGGPKVDGRLGADANKAQADTFAANLAPVVVPLRDRGLSLRAIAADLTRQGIRTARGGAWTASAVAAVLARLDRPESAAEPVSGEAAAAA